MSENAIEVTGISKEFNLNDQIGFKNLLKVKQHPKILLALDEISFTAKKGEILGIIGSNGSGKTTILNLIRVGALPHLRLSDRCIRIERDELNRFRATRRVSAEDAALGAGRALN